MKGLPLGRTLWWWYKKIYVQIVRNKILRSLGHVGPYTLALQPITGVTMIFAKLATLSERAQVVWWYADTTDWTFFVPQEAPKFKCTKIKILGSFTVISIHTDRPILMWHRPWAVGRCCRSGGGQVFENQTQWKRVETRGMVSDVAITKRGRGGFIILPYVSSSLSLRSSNKLLPVWLWLLALKLTVPL